MIKAGPLFRAFAASPINSVERDAAGRVWCQLFPLGKWARRDFPGGELELTPSLFETFIANWRAAGAPALPVDYEHKEDGPASGWIEDLRVSATGELQGAIKWTDDAADDIKADRRRYLSPTWAMQHVNRRTGDKGGPWLFGAALTNSPFFDSMPRVAASAASAAQPPTTSTTEALAGQEKHMNKKRICAALGIPEDCGDDEVMSAIEAKCKVSASLGEVEGKLTAAVKTAVEPLEAKLKAAEEETAKLKAERLAEQTEALIASAKGQGKSVEPMREFIVAAAKRDIDEAKRLVAALPVSMSTQEKGVTGGEVDEAKLQAAASKEYFEKLDAFAKASGQPIATATRLFNRDNAELAKRAFTTR